MGGLHLGLLGLAGRRKVIFCGFPMIANVCFFWLAWRVGEGMLSFDNIVLLGMW